MAQSFVDAIEEGRKQTSIGGGGNPFVRGHLAWYGFELGTLIGSAEKNRRIAQAETARAHHESMKAAGFYRPQYLSPSEDLSAENSIVRAWGQYGVAPEVARSAYRRLEREMRAQRERKPKRSGQGLCGCVNRGDAKLQRPDRETLAAIRRTAKQLAYAEHPPTPRLFTDVHVKVNGIERDCTVFFLREVSGGWVAIRNSADLFDPARGRGAAYRRAMKALSPEERKKAHEAVLRARVTLA
jgi:hypothetical protein